MSLLDGRFIKPASIDPTKVTFLDSTAISGNEIKVKVNPSGKLVVDTVDIASVIEWKNSAIDIVIDSTTLTPTDGDRYLIDWENPGIGDFLGHEGEIATWDAAIPEWTFEAPSLGAGINIDAAPDFIYILTGDSPLTWTAKGSSITPDASISTKGIIEIATQSEVDLGTLGDKVVTPLTLETFLTTDSNTKDSFLYSSENFIADGQSYKTALSVVDEILGYIAPARPNSLTGSALVLANTTTFQAKLPTGLSSAWYQYNAVAGGTISTYIVDNTYSFTTPNISNTYRAGLFANTATYGTTTWNIDGSVNATVAGVGTNNGLTTTNAAFNTLWNKLNASTSIYTQSTEGGKRHTMSHTEAGTTTNFDIYYDNTNTTPTFASALSVSENLFNVKWLSGIRHFGLNSTFRASYTAATGIFNRAYHPTAVSTLSGGSAAFNNIIVNPGDASVSQANPPVYTDPMTVTNKDISFNVASKSSGATVGQIAVSIQKPNGINASSTFNLNRRINTYPVNTSQTFENFFDEGMRLIASDTSFTAFTSNVALPQGEAQFRNGTLTFGDVDYAGAAYNNDSGGSPARSGNQEFHRLFYKTSASNGSIVFSGLSASSIAPFGTGNINVLLYLEGSANYFDLGKSFGSNNGTGSGLSRANSLGAQASTSGSTLNFTFGTNNTSSPSTNNGRYRMIVILRNNTNSITSITTS